ncbi:YceI family protein, partial [candidate division KSB1 bacterium]|nr:YceI family protein [candidate division KSB1 bacterium]
LDTGIGLRNRHMRDNYLETKKYPVAEFKGMVVQVDSLNNAAFSVRTKGSFKLHGVEKTLEIYGVVTLNESGKYTINSQFEIKLQDYNIKVPQLMFLKINEIIKLEISFSLVKVKE